MKYFIQQAQIKFWLCIIFLTILAFGLSGLSLEVKLGGFAIVLGLVYFSRGLVTAFFYLFLLTPFFSALTVDMALTVLVSHGLALVFFEFLFSHFSFNSRQQIFFFILLVMVLDLLIQQRQILINLELSFNFWTEGLSVALTLVLGVFVIEYLLSKDFTQHSPAPYIEQLDLFTSPGKNPRTRNQPFDF